jgi:protein O-GlcNAc transferase
MQQSAGKAEPATSFMPLGEALALAERYRCEGRLTDAETLCRRVLQARPDLPEAEHLMGVIAHQSGKLSEAIEHVRRAVELAPDVALFHANLGEMLRVAGRPRRAVEEAQRALAIDPNMTAALSTAWRFTT